MTLHVEALYTHDACSKLLHINEPGGGGPAAKFFLGRTKEGNLWRFGSDLSDSLVEKLEALCKQEPIVQNLQAKPLHFETYLQLLEPQHLWSGPAYYFAGEVESSRATVLITEKNADLLHGGFEDLIPELPLWQPFVAIVEHHKAVSVCRSVRITAKAHEAGLETLPRARGKGYARDAVTAWATRVRKMGALPMYSTSWENIASQAVARKLNLTMYGADFSVS
jgi:RimJ/RimL family protein N-acetyltransferase